jgi:hypothetical protein
MLRCPLPAASLVASAWSVPLGPTTCAPASVSCVGDGSPALRDTGMSARSGEGLPGDGAVLVVRAMVAHPAGDHPFLAPKKTLAGDGWCLQVQQDLRHPGRQRCRGRMPMARTLACLRFADAMSDTVARLATDSGGLTLGRAGFAPAGRRTKLHAGMTPSNPPRPTGPGHTEIPIR